MKSVKADLPKTTAKATWVKGHEDNKVQYKDLPLEARENIDMVRKCESMRTSEESTPPIPYFSSALTSGDRRRDYSRKREQ
jgi:hypothetical protein